MTLMTFPTCGAPALVNAMVHGDKPDLVEAVSRPGSSDGTNMPAKKTRPLEPHGLLAGSRGLNKASRYDVNAHEYDDDSPEGLFDGVGNVSCWILAFGSCDGEHFGT